MRLAFVIRSLANSGGGAERVLTEITAGLARRGHESIIATFDADGAPTHYPLAASVDVIRLGIGDPSRSAQRSETVRRILALRYLIAGSDADVVIGFMHSAYVPVALAMLGLRTPLIASEHTAMQHYRTRPWLERALVALGQRLADVVTVPSDAARASFTGCGRVPLRVIGNPVRRPDATDPGPRDPVVLAVGRLEAEKDHRCLLEAFARVAGDRPDWCLELVGDGPLRGDLERLAVDLGIADRVAFRGVVADVDGPMRAAGILAVPSRYESFGLATAEALARGLPAVGFADCPGTDELIQHGVNGLLVAGPDRAVALADGLARLMDDPALRVRLGAAAPATVARFAPEVVVDAWEDLLTEVVGAAPEQPA